MMATTRAGGMDGAAVSLSGLCLAHCLALPVAAAALPFLGVVADAEWLHWTFVALAIPVSAMALARAPVMLAVLAVIGLTGLLLGAAGWPSASWETGLTVAGGLVLAGVHIANWRRVRKIHG